MAKEIDMGIASSLTMIALFSATAFLLRSFYKRFTRLSQRAQEREPADEN